MNEELPLDLPEALPGVEAPEGRREVVATILGFKKYEDKFNPGGFVTKMLLEFENGSRGFCTRPGSLIAAQAKDVIKIKATWERKEVNFSFGSRPIAEFLKL